MPNKLFGNVIGALCKALGMFDFLGLMDDDKDKDKRKKNKLSQIDGESMNMSESFLKQSDVLKKILSEFLHEDQNVDLLIKLEICDLLTHYLDQKMDFCLDILKNTFKEYVIHHKFMESLRSGELDMELKRDKISN